MMVILVMVMSVDGRTTRWGDPDIRRWTSTQDQKHFSALISSGAAMVMGRKTFDAARPMIRFPNDRLRLVLTRNPQAYHDQRIPGMLEFTADPPSEVTRDLSGRGHERLLLLGGAETNAAFLRAGCVEELWLTIEPRLFGEGHPLIALDNFDIRLRLVETRSLNATGTLLLKYRVLS